MREAHHFMNALEQLLLAARPHGQHGWHMTRTTPCDIRYAFLCDFLDGIMILEAFRSAGNDMRFLPEQPEQPDNR